MKTETVAIPAAVLSSVETLDELQDWLTAQNPKLIAELRAARREDRAGKFKGWKPRHLPWPAENAGVMVPRRLVGMPADLSGLCKLRVGDYRILYWNYPSQKLLRIYCI